MRGRPFEPGNQVGRGRPRGSRNKRTSLLKAMEEHGEPIVKNCMILALKGDRVALRLCMERLVPICNPSGQRYRLPPVKTVADVGSAFEAVFGEVTRGGMTVEQARELAQVLAARMRFAETEEFDARLRAVEGAQMPSSNEGDER